MLWDTIAKHLGVRGIQLVRGGFDQLMAALGIEAGPRSSTFTIAFIALAAKMAKADGIVSPIEAQTFTEIFEVSPKEQANVMRVFGLAAADTAGFEIYARQVAKVLHDEPKLLRDVFDGLFHIAAADGVLHPGEDAFLRTVASIFGLTGHEYETIKATFVQDAKLAGAADGGSGSDPYRVLAIPRSATDAEVKARYRGLARDLHPDSLTARGVPAQFHAASERKLAVVNAAYDAIQRERGLKVSSARGTSHS